MRNDDVAMVLNGAFAPTHRKVEEFFEDFFSLNRHPVATKRDLVVLAVSILNFDF